MNEDGLESVELLDNKLSTIHLLHDELRREFDAVSPSGRGKTWQELRQRFFHEQVRIKRVITALIKVIHFADLLGVDFPDA